MFETKTYLLTLTAAEVRMVHEVLQHPQLSVPMAHAKVAAGAYEKFSDAMGAVKSDEKAPTDPA